MGLLVVLEWIFSPPNYFEDPIQVTRDKYVMTIANGKVEAGIDASVFDRDPFLRQSLDAALNDRFLGVQLLTHQPYQLSESTITRLHPDGRKDRFIELEAEQLKLSGEILDRQVMDKDGNVLMDTRRERIERKETLAELVEKYRAKDAVVASLLRSYHAAVEDPDNELVHLYEIRDALSKRFGGDAEARSALGISSKSWATLGRLANDEPLRQGRHRGKAEGPLRDATENELTEARATARSMVEAYLEYVRAQ
jgi:hypothetical protein